MDSSASISQSIHREAHPPHSNCRQSVLPIAIAIGIMITLGGVFLTLAAHQILPSGLNAISSLGAPSAWYGVVGFGIVITLINTTQYFSSQQIATKEKED